jgi:hypothetical protein
MGGERSHIEASNQALGKEVISNQKCRNDCAAAGRASIKRETPATSSPPPHFTLLPDEK